jgi:NDP-sugar pyrophosphorylase family protein
MSELLDISAIAATWDLDADGWQIAPDGLDWIDAGSRVKIFEGVSIGPRVRIPNRAFIGSHTQIGANVIIGKSARVGKNVHIGECADIGSYTHIGDGVHVGYYASIDSDTVIGENTVVGNRARIGAHCRIRNDVRISEKTQLGSYSYVGAFATDPVDIGCADGWRKIVAGVNGIAHIGAGCRWFTLARAIQHWSNHAEDRSHTLALLESAKAIAKLKNWKFGVAITI